MRAGAAMVVRNRRDVDAIRNGEGVLDRLRLLVVLGLQRFDFQLGQFALTHDILGIVFAHPLDHGASSH